MKDVSRAIVGSNFTGDNHKILKSFTFKAFMCLNIHYKFHIQLYPLALHLGQKNISWEHPLTKLLFTVIQTACMSSLALDDCRPSSTSTLTAVA